MSIVDVDFDVRTDAGGGDPDSTSKTLRRMHQVLWSKPLPSGNILTLAPESGAYLVHRSPIGTFYLSSDSISNSFAHRKRMKSLIEQIPGEQIAEFRLHGSRVSAKTLFPGRKEGGITINQARGFNRQVSDRMDLTLECIRRHYLNEPSPLSSTLIRYSGFFRLFESFGGYVEFFMLQDLLKNGKINFYLPFDDFSGAATPSTLAEYDLYSKNTIEFLVARKSRIAKWVSSSSN